MSRCLICGSIEDVEDHHLIPRIWKKEDNDETIPLCHHHHKYMPPMAHSTGYPMIEKIMRYMVFVLNKKVPKYLWTLSRLKRFKNGNYCIAIGMTDKFVRGDQTVQESSVGWRRH